MAELATTLALTDQPATRDWRMAAACQHADPDIFFPVSSTGKSVAQMARAKAVCSGCGVRRECLQFALDTQADRVCGGMTEEERQFSVPQYLPSAVERTGTAERAAHRRSVAEAKGRRGGRAVAHPVDKIASGRPPPNWAFAGLGACLPVCDRRSPGFAARLARNGRGARLLHAPAAKADLIRTISCA